MKNFNDFKNCANNGNKYIGTFISGGDQQITELIANIGFDFLWIDTEHSMMDKSSLIGHMIAARAAGVSAFVRMPWNDPVLVKPVLDAGAQGIIFPMINTADEANAAVSSCMYPPDGVRGCAPARCIRYGLDNLNDYFETESKKVLKLVQIETKTGVENIDEIAAVDGVDIIVVGPGDLSMNYGKPNMVTDPEIMDAIRHVVERVHNLGKPVMMFSFASDKNTLGFWLGMGFDMITTGGDFTFVFSGALTAIKNFSQVVNNDLKA